MQSADIYMMYVTSVAWLSAPSRHPIVDKTSLKIKKGNLMVVQ